MPLLASETRHQQPQLQMLRSPAAAILSLPSSTGRAPGGKSNLLLTPTLIPNQTVD